MFCKKSEYRRHFFGYVVVMVILRRLKVGEHKPKRAAGDVLYYSAGLL